MDTRIPKMVESNQMQVLLVGADPVSLNPVQRQLREHVDEVGLKRQTLSAFAIEDSIPESDCVVIDGRGIESTDIDEFFEDIDQPPPIILVTDDAIPADELTHVDSQRIDLVDSGALDSDFAGLALRIIKEATEQRTHRRLSETRRLYEDILKHSSDFVVIIDQGGELSFVTPAVEQVLGYSPEEIRGGNTDELIHPEDRDRTLDAIESAISDPSVDITVEFRIRHKEGHWRWLEVRGRHLDDVNGVLFNARDITQRVTYRADLEAQLAALEASTDGVAILDPEGRFGYANEVNANLHGVDHPEDLLGTHWRTFYDDENRRRIDEEVLPTLDDNGRWHGSLTAIRDDGRAIEQDIALTKLEDGRLSYVVRDVTKQTEYEESLEELHDASTELMASTTEQEVYQRMIEEAESILDLHVCSVMAHDEGTLYPEAVSSGAPPDGVRPMRVDEGDAGKVFQTGEAKLTRHVDEDTTSKPASDAYRSGITVPIGDYGVFQAVSTEPDHFGRQDLDLVGILASYAKVVLDRIDSERDRQREHARLRRLFENTTECVVEVTFSDDNEPIIHTINAAFEEVFGVENEDVEGEPLDDIIVPEDDRDTAREINEKIVQGDVVHRELERQTHSGRRTFLLRTAPFTLEGEPRAFAIYLDITERKRQEERFQTLIEHSTDLITLLDVNGDFLFQSPSVERHLGYDTDEIIGDNAFEYVHPEDRDEVMRVFYEGVENPSRLPTVEFRFKHKDGSWRWLESLGNNQLDNPAVEAFVVNSRDITDRKQREEELRRQNERLDKVSSVISHDLRNPLTVADGYLEMARQECEVKELDTIENSLERMETIINGTLTLARQGQTIGEFEPIDIHQLGRMCWGTVSTGGGDLEVVDAFTIKGDTDRVRQILENLFRNAAKYGGDNVYVEVGTIDADGFYVADDGPGIDEDERAEVFEPGYTTSSSSTGFGLAIVKEIVEAHGWEIAITESELGGARFDIVGVELVDT